MNIVRNIAAVIVGYLIFGLSALLLFKLGGIDPHAVSGIGSLSSAVMVVLIGVIFSFVAGFIAKMITASPSLVANVVLALIIFGFAAFSSVISSGSHYTQFAAMAVFAPISLLGGYVRTRMRTQS